MTLGKWLSTVSSASGNTEISIFEVKNIKGFNKFIANFGKWIKKDGHFLSKSVVYVSSINTKIMTQFSKFCYSLKGNYSLFTTQWREWW